MEIQFPLNDYTLHVYDIFGRVIDTQHLKGGEINYSFPENTVSGMYMLIFQQDNNIVHRHKQILK